MRLHECICTPTRACINRYMHTRTQTHIYTYTYIWTCTYTCIHAHTYTYACICTLPHRQKISTTTPQRVKQCHRRTYASIYICMHIHIYMHIHICTPCSECVADVYVDVEELPFERVHLHMHWCCTEHLFQIACNTQCKKKCTYIYTYTHMHTHTYTLEHTCTCITPSTRCNTDTETHNLCTKMHTHTHTHVYKRIHIHVHTHVHIYTYIHVRTHTHIHIYTHTHTKCTYARTQARLERRRGSDRARSWCRRRKPCTSLSFDAIKLHLAPPMLGLHCTHFLRHQCPSTPHPLFPTYLRTVCKIGSLRSCRKIRGKAAVQQSPSRWARRTSSPRMTKVTVHGESKGQWGTTKPTTAHHTITTARRPDNIRSSALVRGRHTQFMASPCRWPQRDPPKRGYIFAIFAGNLVGSKRLP